MPFENIRKMDKCVGKGKVYDASLTALSKAFDCLDRELLTAKLNACRFNLPALRLVHDDLSNRKLKLRYHIAMV